MEKRMHQILYDVQKSRTIHTKNLALLKSLYNSVNFDDFLNLFLRVLEGVVARNPQNSAVKLSIDFMAKFVAYTCHTPRLSDQGGSCNENEEPTHALLVEVGEQILKFLKSTKDVNCRNNICMFISLVLESLSDNVQLDSNIVNDIQEVLLESIEDIKPAIRVQAILALSRLQDPTDSDCPVIQAFITHLSDPNSLVRKAVVQHLAPNPITITKLTERARDTDWRVRCQFFQRAADIGIRYFKIVQRQFILKCGFMENQRDAKRKFANYLLPNWLANSEKNYFKLLKYIKLDSDEIDIKESEDLSARVMTVFFQTEPINELIEVLPLNEDQLIAENEAKGELIHYWNLMVRYLRHNQELVELVDRVIPELVPFAEYIERLAECVYSNSKEHWEMLNFQSMLFYLLDILEGYDLNEQAGRKAVHQLLTNLLGNYRLQPRLLNRIMNIWNRIVPKGNDITFEICQVISDINEPLVEKEVTEDTRRSQQYQVSKIRVKTTQLDVELENALRDKDFAKADQLKQQIDQLKRVEADLVSSNAPKEQTREKSEDPERLCWCLDILAAMLSHVTFETLTPPLITLREEFLMPLMTNTTAEVADRAFKCLTIYCACDLTMAEKHLSLICAPIFQYQIVANLSKSILIDSIKVVSDLICTHGFRMFKSQSEKSSSSKRRLYNEESALSDIMNRELTIELFVNVMLDTLDDEEFELRDIGIKSLGKLILYGYPIDPSVITRLAIIHFNPISENHIRSLIGNVLLQYVQTVKAGKETVAKATVPIITTVMTAAKTSPLAAIDHDALLAMLVTLTDPTENGVVNHHVDMAHVVLQELSKQEPALPSSRLYVKLLTMLHIEPEKTPTIQEMMAKIEKLLEKDFDKRSCQYLKKLLARLSSTPTSEQSIKEPSKGQLDGSSVRSSSISVPDSSAVDEANVPNENTDEKSGERLQSADKTGANNENEKTEMIKAGTLTVALPRFHNFRELTISLTRMSNGKRKKSNQRSSSRESLNSTNLRRSKRNKK